MSPRNRRLRIQVLESDIQGLSSGSDSPLHPGQDTSPIWVCFVICNGNKNSTFFIELPWGLRQNKEMHLACMWEGLNKYKLVYRCPWRARHCDRHWQTIVTRQPNSRDSVSKCFPFTDSFSHFQPSFPKNINFCFTPSYFIGKGHELNFLITITNTTDINRLGIKHFWHSGNDSTRETRWANRQTRAVSHCKINVVSCRH